MQKLFVEYNLETYISFEEKDEAEILATTQFIKENWIEYLNNNKDNFKVNILFELGE